MRNDSMFQLERQKKLLDYVNKVKKATVSELSDYLNISKVTVRRYLSELESKDLVIKTHGGALSVDNELSIDLPYANKKDLHKAEKKRIGIAATKLINDGDVIILDAGSTTFAIAQQIVNRNITVLTNDLKIAFELSTNSNVKLIISGGPVQRNVYTVIGSTSEKFFNKVHVDKVFLGADAFNLECGVTNRTLEEASIKKAMIKAADEVILVTDSSKMGHKALANVCKTEDINAIVTDKISDEYEKVFKKNSTNIILA
jgi:DeoR/GlpR family transcriptional regulator of sugar metabolism